MRYSTFLTLVTVLSVTAHPIFAATPQAKPAADQEITEQEVPAGDEVSDAAATKAGKTIKGAFKNVVCVETTTLNVRNSSLRKVLFSVKRYEKVKIFQGWGNNSQAKRVGGKTHTFVKVQFPGRADKDQDTGWIAKGFIKPQSECSGAVKEEKKIVEKIERDNPVSRVQVSGLDDAKCCEFPLNTSPDRGITDKGMWNFGWSRSHGNRTHAACDLYHNLGDSIVAVAPGVVVRDLYFFYQNTYALEVRHAGGFVVRYGEVRGKNATGVSSGRRVEAGQAVGYMGKTNHPNPMLHFEMYSGKANGSLSGRGNKYQRRSDLMNPTPYLVKWQDAKFRDRK
jgi:murein DD-endopeptidase MepM/ murein hydrolase activator NlpD